MVRSLVTHRNAYLLGLLGAVFSLSISVFSLSVSLFFLAANWLLENNRIERVKALRKNPGFWLPTGILLLGVIGLIHTSNFQYAIDDLRIKLPLFLLPFFIVTSKPLNKNEFFYCLGFFSFWECLFLRALLPGTIGS